MRIFDDKTLQWAVSTKFPSSSPPLPIDPRRAAVLSTPMRSRVALLWLVLAGLGASPAFAEPARWIPVRGQSLVSFDAVFPPADFSGFGRDPSGEFEGGAPGLAPSGGGRPAR